jgi:hypothetical protein
MKLSDVWLHSFFPLLPVCVLYMWIPTGIQNYKAVSTVFLTVGTGQRVMSIQQPFHCDQ